MVNILNSALRCQGQPLDLGLEAGVVLVGYEHAIVFKIHTQYRFLFSPDVMHNNSGEVNTLRFAHTRRGVWEPEITKPSLSW